MRCGGVREPEGSVAANFFCALPERLWQVKNCCNCCCLPSYFRWYNLRIPCTVERFCPSTSLNGHDSPFIKAVPCKNVFASYSLDEALRVYVSKRRALYDYIIFAYNSEK